MLVPLTSMAVTTRRLKHRQLQSERATRRTNLRSCRRPVEGVHGFALDPTTPRKQASTFFILVANTVPAITKALCAGKQCNRLRRSGSGKLLRTDSDRLNIDPANVSSAQFEQRSEEH